MTTKTAGRIALAILLLSALSSGNWSEQTSGVTAALYDVDCVGPNRAWAVGAGGTIVRTTDRGQNWTGQPSGTTEDLYGVSFVDESNGWVAGEGPVILRTTDGGESWTSQPPGTSNDLLGIAFADLNRGWATGVSGTIIGTTDGGASWASEISGIWGWYRGVAAASPSAAWAIGADWFNHVAPVYRYDGTRWSLQHEITRHRDGQDISEADGGYLWAVADSGTIAHSPDGGANWTTQNSGTTVMLSGVSAVSADYCWVAGADGTILATSDGGTTWSAEASGVTTALYGVRMADTANGWAVGAGGMILHRAGGQAVAERPAATRTSRHGTLVRDALRLQLAPGGRVAVRLYDAGGRLVRTRESDPVRDELVLRLDGIPAGAYVVVVSAPSGSWSWRFVKVD